MTHALKPLWRALVRLRYHLHDRRQMAQPYVEQVAGLDLLILPGVLGPRRFYGGAFLAEMLDGPLVRADARLLDLGCGSGVVSLVAARRAAEVAASDLCATAVRCTQVNLLLNPPRTAVHVAHGDLFAPWAGQRFDQIVCNPPFLTSDQGGSYRHALVAGDLLARLAEQLNAHLAPHGELLLLLSTLANQPALLAPFRAAGYQIAPLATRETPSERLILYRVYDA